jgi:alpha-N-arabinofuranosidase
VLTSRVTIHPAFTIAPVPPRLFGSFVEHMGRCVYGGIYEPEHAEADVDGMRLDVLKLVRELGVSVVRYPGGNFVSGYQWEDGVGPRDQRPTRLDLAWRSRESNQFGLNEFMAWCRLAGAEPMMAVNLGTRGLADACNLLEYTNHPGGTYYSDLRSRHGVAQPHNIKLWCLGNEMDGPWQIGHKTAEEYGRLAAETARAMRQVDPSIELVVCGSSNDRMPTFGSWESTVLDHTYDDVDYISLHAYYMQGDGDLATFLASGAAMDRFIDGVIATADHVRAKRRSKKQMMLSFDEWNLWDETRFVGHTNLEWASAPRLIEETYTARDAVVFGSLLMSLLRHADRVTVACLAQLVNVIAPIRSESGSEAWRQTIFYPFALTARHAKGNVLHVQQDAPTYPTGIGDVALTDTVAIHDPDSGDIVILTVSRSQRAPVNVNVDLRAFPELRVAEHLRMGGVDLDATNTEGHPDRVVPEQGRDASVRDGHLEATLPPLSWNLLRLVPLPQ